MDKNMKIQNIQMKINILPCSHHRVCSNPSICQTTFLDALLYVLFRRTLEYLVHVV